MNLMESHDDQCEWCSEACGCDSRASLHGLLRKAANDIEALQKQLAASQAYGQQLRKALEFLVENEASFGYSRPYDEARKCLALPQDNNALQQACGEEFRAHLFNLKPHEVVGPLFEYFASALRTAPKEKIAEFFVHFEKGVRDTLSGD